MAHEKAVLDYIRTENVKDTVKKRTSESQKKARISIAIDREFLIWIDEMIKKRAHDYKTEGDIRMMNEYASPPRDLDKELCQLLSDLHLHYTPQQVTGMMKVTDKPRFLWKHRNTCIQMRLWHTQYRTGEPWLHIVVDKSSRVELAKTIAHTVTRVMKIKVRVSE